MNKGGVGSGSGGPTAAAAAAAAQKQKTLLQRVDNDIGNIVDNFSFLVNVARVNDPPVRNSQEAFMMEMRAARMITNKTSAIRQQEFCTAQLFLFDWATLNFSTLKFDMEEYHPLASQIPQIMGSIHSIVQAADSLLKLVSELKQTAIFSGFASLNDHVEQRIDEFNKQAEKTDRMLARIGEEAAASLKELESHYYSSALRTSQLTRP